MEQSACSCERVNETKSSSGGIAIAIPACGLIAFTPTFDVVAVIVTVAPATIAEGVEGTSKFTATSFSEAAKLRLEKIMSTDTAHMAKVVRRGKRQI